MFVAKVLLLSYYYFTVLHGDFADLLTRTHMRGAEPAVRLVRKMEL